MRTLNADSGAALALQVTSTAASKLSQTAELTTKAIISPGATITAQRAVDKTNFIRADMVPQRLHGTEWNFIHTSGNWEPGRVSLFEGGAYKVENIRKSDDGSQVLHTVNAAAGDLLSDLMYEIGHPAIASC